MQNVELNIKWKLHLLIGLVHLLLVYSVDVDDTDELENYNNMLT